MIDMEKQTITFDGKPLPIIGWTVWFATPFGLIDNLDEAVAKCKDNDMLPHQLVFPVPIALDQAGRYEVVVRS